MSNAISSSKRVFLCYRREDAQLSAGRIADFLSNRLGDECVFRYSEHEGVPFEAITKKLSDSEVVVVLIGDRFLKASDGRRWLDDQDDFLRVELETAFARYCPVIPLLLEYASLGYSQDYPDTLRPLSRINPVRVSDRHFVADCENLLKVIERSRSSPPPPPGEREKISAEDLVLKWSSWRSPKHDNKNPSGEPVYRFDVITDAVPAVRNRIQKVIYFLPPRWETSPATVTDETDEKAFRLRDLAWASLTVRARVYIKDQGEPITLST
jgi:TIR domain